MNSVTMRRKHTKWNIAQNPVEIIINRTERIDMGGYFDTISSQKGPFSVRLFTAGGSPQTVTTLAGTKQVDQYYGLLADHLCDIQAGTMVQDEFEAFGMRFLVKAIYPQVISEQVVGYQGELERVS